MMLLITLSVTPTLCLNPKSLAHQKQLFPMDLSNVDATLFLHGARSPVQSSFHGWSTGFNCEQNSKLCLKRGSTLHSLYFPGLLQFSLFGRWSHSVSWVYDKKNKSLGILWWRCHSSAVHKGGKSIPLQSCYHASCFTMPWEVPRIFPIVSFNVCFEIENY